MKIVGAFDADTLRILRALPGIQVVDRTGARAGGVDAVITDGDRKVAIAVEMKTRVNAGTARQLIDLARTLDRMPLLVVAEQATEDARRLLRAGGIGIVDGRGNAHLEVPGVVIHIEGKERGVRPTKLPTRLSGKAGIVAQALLLDPDRAWQVATLADVAGVSTGLAHRVLTRLEGERIVHAEGRGPDRVRHVAAPAALLDLWAEEQNDAPRRATAYLLAQTNDQVVARLGEALEAAAVDHAVTGAAAAALLAPFLTAVPVAEFWVADAAATGELFNAAGAESVTIGHNIVLLQTKGDAALVFPQRVGGRRFVNRFRLYVDLLKDPRRGREQAQHLRDEVIGF